MSLIMGDSAKEALTQLLELFTLIPCELKDFKRFMKSVFEIIHISIQI